MSDPSLGGTLDQIDPRLKSLAQQQHRLSFRLAGLFCLSFFLYGAASVYRLELLAARAHLKGHAILAPELLYIDPLFLLSLQLAFVCSIAGLPHLRMRFFTEPNVHQARTPEGVRLSRQRHA